MQTDEKQVKKRFSIAIDGPNGSGKSTVAKLLAQELKIIYVDTGAMYRAVALYLLRKGIPADNFQAFDDVIKEYADALEIDIRYQNGVQKVFLFDEDVTEFLRTREVTEAASKFAVNKHIRVKLVNLQRLLALGASVVMDGRDIGSCVLPEAELKIYLDADVDTRVDRRVSEYAAMGIAADYEAIKKEITERDNRDRSREHSPLTQAPDAIVIDSSQIGINQVKDIILHLLKDIE